MTVESDSKDQNPPIKLYDDRELVLIKLNEAIDYLHKKGIKGRYKNNDTEKLRIQYLKALAYTCNVYSNIKRDIDIEDLNQKIEDMTNEIKLIKEVREDEERYSEIE